MRHFKKVNVERLKPAANQGAKELVKPQGRSLAFTEMDTPGVYLKCVCPSCQQHIEFPIVASGERVPCPSCNIEIQLPVTEAEPAAPILPTFPPRVPPRFGLPEITEPAFSAIQVRSSEGENYYTVNLLEYTCTCPSFIADHSGAPQGDFGRMCKHICRALYQPQFLPLMDRICLAIVEEGHGVYPGCLAQDDNGNPVYITGVNSTGWLNVFALKRRDGKTYYRFGYETTTGRWSYGLKPKIRDEIVNPNLAMPLPPMPRQDSGIAVAILIGAGKVLLALLRGILLVVGTILAAIVAVAFGKRSRRKRW